MLLFEQRITSFNSKGILNLLRKHEKPNPETCFFMEVGLGSVCQQAKIL